MPDMRLFKQLSGWLLAMAMLLPLLAHAENYSDHWYNPSESGWGVTIADHDTQLFAVWYAYDTDGSPLWFTVPGGTFNARSQPESCLNRRISGIGRPQCCDRSRRRPRGSAP